MPVASLVLGIVSCVFCFDPFSSIPCGILAIILAVKANKQLKEQNTKDGKATAGFVTGIIGLSLGALSLAAYITAGWFIYNIIRTIIPGILNPGSMPL
ncbi:MAG: DUF4190 domain-containing protein [Bacillota bacterium]|nr:DUF4190 domain-containing protein [Bacillota bacterium]